MLVVGGCQVSSTPTSTRTPELLPPNKPVTFSAVKTEFGQPLSSGLTLPDMVENALRSIVEIRTSYGGGTGFIVNRDGLVVTNKHVVQGVDSASIRLVSGSSYTARVVREHDTLDLAYLLIESSDQFTPIAVSDSDSVRVGESVIVIGFPITDVLGSEPTVSEGIVSARRTGGLIQTDAPVNPGNSGGPMLDLFGNVIGVVVSRIEEAGGRDIIGVGFAIPINEVKADLGEQVSESGEVLPTPTPFPTIGPTPNVGEARATVEAIDAQKRMEEQATRTAIEAEQEVARYAASLEATRVAQIPTPTPEPTSTPEPTPTPTPLPMATPHPSTYCREWEALVLEWIRDENLYEQIGPRSAFDSSIPDHPNLAAIQADGLCITELPLGRHGKMWYTLTVGTGEGQLLPGTYRYRSKTGDDRVSVRDCTLRPNYDGYYDAQLAIELPYGEPFEFTFHTYHNEVWFGGCGGFLYRVGADPYGSSAQ